MSEIRLHYEFTIEYKYLVVWQKVFPNIDYPHTSNRNDGQISDNKLKRCFTLYLVLMEFHYKYHLFISLQSTKKLSALVFPLQTVSKGCVNEKPEI